MLFIFELKTSRNSIGNFKSKSSIKKLNLIFFYLFYKVEILYFLIELQDYSY